MQGVVPYATADANGKPCSAADLINLICTRPAAFEAGCWPDPELRRVVEMMLEVHPARRATAHGLAEDTWLRQVLQPKKH